MLSSAPTLRGSPSPSGGTGPSSEYSGFGGGGGAASTAFALPRFVGLAFSGSGDSALGAGSAFAAFLGVRGAFALAFAGSAGGFLLRVAGRLVKQDQDLPGSLQAALYERARPLLNEQHTIVPSARGTHRSSGQSGVLHD